MIHLRSLRPVTLMTLLVLGCSRQTASQDGDKGEHVPPALVASTAPTAPNTAVSPPAFDGTKVMPLWVEGSSEVFAVDLATQLELTGNAPVVVQVQGELTVTVERRGGQVSRWQFAMSSVQVKAPGNDQIPGVDQLARQLSTDPFQQDWAEGIRVRDGVAAGTAPLTLGIWRTLAASLPAFVPQGTELIIREHDAAGSYQARWKRAEEPAGREPRRYGRQKVAYQAPPEIKALIFGALHPRAPKVVSSSLSVGLQGTRISSVTLDEEVAVELGPQTESRSKTKLSLTWVKSKEAEVFAPATGRVSLAPGDQPPGVHDSAALDRTRIGEYTVESALKELQAAARASTGANQAAIQQRSRPFSALAALLRREPKALPAVKAALNSGAPEFSLLLDVLSSSRSSAALDELVAQANLTSRPENARKAAGSALIRAQAPTPSAARALLKLLSDPVLRVHAIYGIGSYARRLRALGETTIAGELDLALRSELGNAKGNARLDVLRGIANSGDAGALTLVKPLLHDADPTIQGAAADAISFMDHPEVDGLLALRLLGGAETMGETATMVKLAILDAAARRPPGPQLLGAINRVARTAKEPHLRHRCIRVLAGPGAEPSESRDTLVELAKGDPQPEVQAAASAVLRPQSAAGASAAEAARDR